MTNKKKYEKYETRGADYHYKQIDKKKINYFNAYVYARYFLELKLILRELNNLNVKSIKILDVGCGDAVPFHILTKYSNYNNLELFGIDSSEIAIETAKNKIPKATFKIGDIQELPFEDNSFHVIISSDVIEHISNFKKMLTEIVRVGKNNTLIIVGTPIRYTEELLDKRHYNEFFPLEYKEILSEFFTEVKIVQSHDLQYTLLYNRVSTIFKKKQFIFRYLINLSSIFLKKNPFLRIKKNDKNRYSYMFGIGKIKK